MKKKYFIFIFIVTMNTALVFGQDPHFSQFFMAPQFVNPSLVGKINSQWVIMSNLRQQWGNAGTPFNTETIAGEYKFSRENDKMSALGVGLSFMGDRSMNGSFRSTYASISVGYHQALNENSSIGAGFQTAYANRTIDYSKLTFAEQFTSGGFDVTLPSGEIALSNMKPFFTIGTGLLYNIKKDNFNLDAGISLFHINKPKQTFLKDGNEILPMRLNLNANLEYMWSQDVVLMVNACYQQQAKPAYFTIGGALGFDISEYDVKSMLYAGGWFREGDSYYPYVGWSRGVLQVGFTYDITCSKQIQGPYVPKSFEMSVVIRNKNSSEGVIPCPWK